MNLLRFLDRKFTFSEQKNYIIGYLFFGLPVAEVLKIFLIKDYQLSIEKISFIFFLNLILLSPLITNYFRHRKKYKLLLREVSKEKEISLKAIFDFDNFKKNEIYSCYSPNVHISNLIGRKGRTAQRISKYFENLIVVVDSDNRNHNLKNIINKFEINDIKRERLKKLKKLKRSW